MQNERLTRIEMTHDFVGPKYLLLVQVGFGFLGFWDLGHHIIKVGGYVWRYRVLCHVGSDFSCHL